MMSPSQLSAHFYKYGEPPVHYFEQESKYSSLVALMGNHRAKAIANKIAGYRQEAYELEQRQQTDFKMTALTSKINQSILLPIVLINLIGEYARGTDIIFLAKSLLKQLESLKMKYGKRFTEFEAKPNVLNILEEALVAAAEKKHLSICWDGRNPHAAEQERKFAWDATKVIAKLINGVQIKYGSSKKVTERFAKTKSVSFYLLKFFKDFVLNGPADPAVQKFILDLLELANTHTDFEMTNQMIQRECKTFPALTQASPVEVIADAEKQLNAYLTKQGCEEWAVNFMIVNQAGIIIYVNANSVLAIYKLMELASEFSVHLSPLFIYQLLQLSSVDNQKWASYGKEQRGKAIRNLISPCFNIQPQAVRNVTYFNTYGYEIKVGKTAFNQIKSASLFGQSGDQKMINPVGRSILRVLQPLEKNLNSYDAERKLIVKSFIDGFNQDFREKFATISNSEEAFRVGEKFVLEWLSNLTLLPKTFPNLIPSTWLFTSELEKDFNQTVKNIQDLKNSLQQLKHQSRTGAIALALHVLPPDRSSRLGASKASSSGI